MHELDGALDEAIEEPSGQPLRDQGQRVDSGEVPESDLVRQRQARRDRSDQLGDDMVSQRRLGGVAVVTPGVRGVELVPVLAVDQPILRRSEAGGIGERELVDEPGLAEGALDVRVPPHLDVVVAWQVDHPMAGTSRE